MPLIFIEKLNESADTRLALWRMTEAEDELKSFISTLDVEYAETLKTNKSTARRREIVTVKMLLRKLFDGDVMLSHDKSGRPFLDNGYNVSISHTKGFASVIVSRAQRVSVDVEYVSERVLKITDRFIRSDECAPTTVSALLHWCVKETMYKLFSADDLGLLEMRVNTVDGDEEKGLAQAEHLRRNEIVPVFYRISKDVVLTYAYCN